MKMYSLCLLYADLDVFWPAERTEKIPMGSIKNVVTEPIEGHEDYHMMVCVYRNISNKLCIISLYWSFSTRIL